MLEADRPFDPQGKPAVILVIGVNGVGKTTSIGKLASLYAGQGKRVLLAAGDTFRARPPSSCRSGPTGQGCRWSATTRDRIRHR